MALVENALKTEKQPGRVSMMVAVGAPYPALKMGEQF